MSVHAPGDCEVTADFCFFCCVFYFDPWDECMEAEVAAGSTGCLWSRKALSMC